MSERVGAPTGPAGTAVEVTSLATGDEEARVSTGIGGFDRVLGGGLVPGSVILLAGAPGIGKSTLLLQLAARLQQGGRSCLVASGEEARGQVAARARRLGIDGEGLAYVPGRDLEQVAAAAVSVRPDVLIVDSVHTIRGALTEGGAGGPAQVRACVDALVGIAKEHRLTMLLAGHVTKAGDLAGPRTIEHAVDTVLTFEGEPRSGLRVLSGGKNRFGLEGEVAWFEMGSRGLEERESLPPSEVGGEPGCAVGLVLAGRRGLAAEVQTLVVPSEGPPRRQVTGLDPRRFQIVTAVTDRLTGLRLGRAEVYGTASGGFRLDDPGADLAVAAALVSAGTGISAPGRTAFVGELSLTGVVRPVGGLEQRVAAGVSSGIDTVICAGAEREVRVPEGVRLVRVRHAREALRFASRQLQRSA